MFQNFHKNDEKIKKTVHDLSEGMHLKEMRKLLLIADAVEKIKEKENKMKIFFLLIKREIKRGNILTKKIEDVNKIQKNFFEF